MARTNFSCTAQSGGRLGFFPHIFFFLGNQTSVIRDYLSIRVKLEKNTWLEKNSGTNKFIKPQCPDEIVCCLQADFFFLFL